jgi:sugar lactone lactonase YvrE
VIVPLELRPVIPAPQPTPVFGGYEPTKTSKPSFSFVKAVVLLVGVTIFAVVWIAITVKPSRVTTPSTYLPPRSQTSPKATPTPYLFTFGGEGTGQGLFQNAQEVAVDGAGNIYVTDDTLRVQKFDAKGRFLSLWTLPSATRYSAKVSGGPDRLLADRDGRVYVVIGGAVLRYDQDGKLLGVVNGSDYAYDATLKADGGMVIVSGNSADDQLVVLDAKGKAVKRVHRFISAQLDKQIPVEALKVAVDGVGNIFGIYALGSVYGEHWYDSSDLAVFRFTADGIYVDRFGGGGNAAGQFKMPNAIAVDSQSRVYVCDRSDGIHVFTSDGRYMETVKTLSWVDGMTIDMAGDLLVVGNNKVSRLVLSK